MKSTLLKKDGSSQHEKESNLLQLSKITLLPEKPKTILHGPYKRRQITSNLSKHSVLNCRHLFMEIWFLETSY